MIIRAYIEGILNRTIECSSKECDTTIQNLLNSGFELNDIEVEDDYGVWNPI